jgi:molybdenum cofactor synthesis domain-containing protein
VLSTIPASPYRAGSGRPGTVTTATGYRPGITAVKHKTAIIFCIGRELLEGLVLDRNAHFIAGRLNELGVRVVRITVLDDDETEMVAAFKRALDKKLDYVFTTGGMGPGHEDMTRQCWAIATGIPLQRDARATEMIQKSYRRLFAAGVVDDQTLTEERLRMAMLPAGAQAFENPIGIAPALLLQTGATKIMMLPGVPEELRLMFTSCATPMIREDAPGAFRETRHIKYPGRDESAITRLLGELSRRFPGVQCRARVQGSESGYVIHITLYGESTSADALRRQLDEAEADLRARLGMDVRTSGHGL